MQIAPFLWLCAIFVFIIAEAITLQLVSIWFVFGSIAACIASAFNAPVYIQFIVFVAVSVLSLIATRPVIKRIKKSGKLVKTNSDRLIGKTGIVVEDIDPISGTGQVKVARQKWSAKTNGEIIEKDSQVKILAIEGVKLVVEREILS